MATKNGNKTGSRKGSTTSRTSTARRSRSKAAPPEYLKQTHRAVRSVFKAAEDLPSFLATAGTLSLPHRRLLVDQASVLIEENYVHLPFKRAMHAADPVQALKLLRHRLDAMTTATMGPESVFHTEMLRIFASVRDLHTNYLLPAPFAQRTAFLPFDIEEYYVGGERHYQVSHVVSGFNHPTFVPGVEVTSWSGVPIERAVEVNADRHAGSNRAARHSRGVQFLTLRSLVRSLPPDEAWIEVGYVDLGGSAASLRHDWMVFDAGSADNSVDPDSATLAAASLGVDLELEAATQAKRMLFAPAAVAAAARQPKLTTSPAAADSDVPTTMPELLRARNVTTSHGEVGHLRIFSFNVNDPDGFIREIERLVGLLAPTMLIIDVRGNGGGHIFASEGLLQLFTPRRITPEPTQFIVTALNARIVRRHRANPVGIDLSPWLASLEQAVETGAAFSTGHPITPDEFANSLGQRYRGRVLCVTDARCYSATDIFAAGFQDHEIGPVLGVDDNTGAGGANVWTHGLLQQLLELPAPADDSSPYVNLPNGSNMRVSIRRTLRVNARSGTPVEDLGVEPDERHALTRNDLLLSNVDLIEHAAGLLASRPLRTLETVVLPVADGVRPVDVTTDKFGRLDVYVDERPFASLNVLAGTNRVEVPTDAATVRFEGWSGSHLVVAATVDLT